MGNENTVKVGEYSYDVSTRDGFIRAVRASVSMGDKKREVFEKASPEFRKIPGDELLLSELRGFRGTKVNTKKLGEVLFDILLSEPKTRQEILDGIENATQRKQLDTYWTKVVKSLGDRIIVGVQATGNAKLYSRLQHRAERHQVA